MNIGAIIATIIAFLMSNFGHIPGVPQILDQIGHHAAAWGDDDWDDDRDDWDDDRDDWDDDDDWDD